MKGKEALKFIETDYNMNLQSKHYKPSTQRKHINTIKAELDKLDRIKEVVKEVNYIGLYKNGCIKIKQIIEGSEK